MDRQSRSSHRPPRRRSSEDATPAASQERADREFRREIEMRLQVFVSSEAPELELEPMNSYRRHLVHNIAKEFQLATESRGDDRDRRVCVIRTKETRVPKSQAKAKLWDFGSQTFPVNPGLHGVRLALKSDGSIELHEGADTRHILHERLVTARQIRIRNGQIVVPDDPNW